MESVFAAIEGAGVAEYLRHGRWSYAAVNALHVFGIALLVGAILPLDLRLLGFWRATPVEVLAPVLVPVAASGLAIAVCAGVLLFSVRAQEYSGNGFLQAKVVLVATGALAAVTLHRRSGPRLEGASSARLALHGSISLTCWIGALVCGRLIAFAAD